MLKWGASACMCMPGGHRCVTSCISKISRKQQMYMWSHDHIYGHTLVTLPLKIGAATLLSLDFIEHPLGESSHKAKYGRAVNGLSIWSKSFWKHHRVKGRNWRFVGDSESWLGALWATRLPLCLVPHRCSFQTLHTNPSFWTFHNFYSRLEPIRTNEDYFRKEGSSDPKQDCWVKKNPCIVIGNWGREEVSWQVPI